ncbi:MAG: hypothetical protein R3272_09620 [Candidatus Promineifilaceae bacterium]|nr:hypothetical protein [Candidatus Promineifilaceae bacterium]
MQSKISLTGARARPLRLRIHPSWAILLPLLALPLALYYLPEAYPAFSTSWYWTAGFAAGLGVLLSAMAHEAGHLLAAHAVDLPLARVTLYPFGGVPRFVASSPSRHAMLVFALGGPLASALTAAVLGGLWLATGQAIVLWLALFNLVLGLLNLLPAQPLDGVRLLNALAPADDGRSEQYEAGDRFRARITFWLGEAVALVFIWSGGMTLLLGEQLADGFLLLFFGALLQWVNVDYYPDKDAPPATAEAADEAKETLAAVQGTSLQTSEGAVRSLPDAAASAKAPPSRIEK